MVFCVNVCLAIVTWLMLYNVCLNILLRHIITMSIYQHCKPSIEGFTIFAGQAQRRRPCGDQGLDSASHVKLGAAGDARARGCHA